MTGRRTLGHACELCTDRPSLIYRVEEFIDESVSWFCRDCLIERIGGPARVEAVLQPEAELEVS